LATGETHTVRSYIEKAFAVTGRKLVWEGEGVNEIGKDAETGKVRVRIDPKYFRPAEVELLLGDPTKAKEKLGWTRKVTYDELVTEMVVADVQGGLNNDTNN
jgi:GDPmannose 4,6-dehydratase